MTGMPSGSADWPGPVFLAIGNSVDPAMRPDYEVWHGGEHVPERLTMPGFLAAKRYAGGRGASARYLTLYDLGSAEALETPEYLDLLANPTPETRRMRPAMGAFSRSVYRETGRAGRGLGRYLAGVTWQGAGEEAVPPPSLVDLIGRSGVLSVRTGVALAARPHPAFPTMQDASAAQGIALLSGSDREALPALLRGALASRIPSPAGLTAFIYELIAAY
ncbi:hypothetical protein [Bosea sp. 2YAB26]|jgi:hypothetical protein|uniref:hypothetical protein n=1 Tax=Bosea sp. 2YAB26 TaxID=3237478 RepID=UPI003F90314B